MITNHVPRIYTCATVAFKGNPYFFTRDAGLVCRSLQSAGVDSKAILPLPAFPDDVQNGSLIRVPYKSLLSAKWWRSLKLDGVVLYSWAAPRYLLVARAIHKAGIPLSIHLDWDGLAATRWNTDFPIPRRLWEYIKGLGIDIGRHIHLRYANYITTFPAVQENLRKGFFYGSRIADKCRIMACPVHPSFVYSNQEKQDVMICVGRWDDERQKRSRFMMAALELFYARGGKTKTEIYGKLTGEMERWHESLPEEIKEKIHLKGFVDNAHLGEVYKRSRIIFCTSSFEGSHNVSGEALCCGMSVVTTNRPEVFCVQWYTTHQSGTVSKEDSPDSFADALYEEAEAWYAGKRNPMQISQSWIPLFHAEKVFSKVFHFALDELNVSIKPAAL